MEGDPWLTYVSTCQPLDVALLLQYVSIERESQRKTRWEPSPVVSDPNLHLLHRFCISRLGPLSGDGGSCLRTGDGSATLEITNMVGTLHTFVDIVNL
jgi:hypothetical protein